MFSDVNYRGPEKCAKWTNFPEVTIGTNFPEVAKGSNFPEVTRVSYFPEVARSWT